MAAISTAARNNFHLLGVEDTERVIAIDRAHTGRASRRFFEKRLAAAKVNPDDFIPIGVMRGGALRGFAIARILRGEFGHERAVAVLDAVGVELEGQERGIGQFLMAELTKTMQRMGVCSLQSQADWTNHSLLRFFSAAGFKLSPRIALERSVSELLDETIEEV